MAAELDKSVFALFAETMVIPCAQGKTLVALRCQETSVILRFIPQARRICRPGSLIPKRPNSRYGQGLDPDLARVFPKMAWSGPAGISKAGVLKRPWPKVVVLVVPFRPWLKAARFLLDSAARSVEQLQQYKSGPWTGGVKSAHHSQTLRSTHDPLVRLP